MQIPYNMDRPMQYFEPDFGGAAATPPLQHRPPPAVDHHLMLIDGDDNVNDYNDSATHSDSEGSDATCCCSSESCIDNEAFIDDATSAAAVPQNVLFNDCRRQPVDLLGPLPESGGPACNLNHVVVVKHPPPMASCISGSNDAMTIRENDPLPPLDRETLVMIHLDVEACLRQGMTKEETSRALTQCRGYHILAVWLVWAGLEKQNPDFFQRYTPQLRKSFQL